MTCNCNVLNMQFHVDEGSYESHIRVRLRLPSLLQDFVTRHDTRNLRSDSVDDTVKIIVSSFLGLLVCND